MDKIAIVAIGYNRPSCMERLLFSLTKAEYDNDNVNLYISLDKCDDDRVERVADKFDWKYGDKKILTHEERMGLRKHVLECGNILEDYDALIVLEDDIIVSPSYYLFTKEAVNKYKGNCNVAGISLYNHLWNVIGNIPFQPALSRYDTYFFQFAQSWGQVWLKEQWRDFICWYSKNNDDFKDADGVPEIVSMWPNSSWLKYHIRYCVEKNKYFVYPYKSLTTCFSETGEHNKRRNSLVQVPMLNGLQRDYRFPEIDAPDTIIYDVYFERIIKNQKIYGVDSNDICFDLNCSKKTFENKRYLATTAKYPFKIIKEFGLDCRPIEQNIIMDVDGKGVFLYEIDRNKAVNATESGTELFRYHFRIYGGTKRLLFVAIDNVIHKIFRKIR